MVAFSHLHHFSNPLRVTPALSSEVKFTWILVSWSASVKTQFLKHPTFPAAKFLCSSSQANFLERAGFAHYQIPLLSLGLKSNPARLLTPTLLYTLTHELWGELPSRFHLTIFEQKGTQYQTEIYFQEKGILKINILISTNCQIPLTRVAKVITSF